MFAVVFITVFLSHMITVWLKIETVPGGYWVIGPGEGKAPVYMAGSSLARDGISWPVIAEKLNHRIEGWGLAGSSPSEWEYFQDREAHTTLALFVVSIYDLNEYFLSDYRAYVVPLTQTLQDLRQSHADWPFFKRVLSMYPLTYIRVFFPSAGRSDGVIRGLRKKVEAAITATVAMEIGGSPALPFDDFKKDKITDWSQGMLLRRLVAMREACLGRHNFNGPKSLAFLRMLDRAEKQGRVVVVVLPVSTAYTKELVSEEVKQNFEEALTKVQQSVSNVTWIRLDQLDPFSADEYFQDLVHMNSYGQKVLTEIVVDRLKGITGLP